MTEEIDDSDVFYHRALGCRVEKIILNFVTHTACVVLSAVHGPGSAQWKPDAARWRRYFELQDPLLKRVVALRELSTMTVWPPPKPMSHRPACPAGRSQKGVCSDNRSRDQSKESNVLVVRQPDIRLKRTATISHSANTSTGIAAAKTSGRRVSPLRRARRTDQ